jgi:formylglycine-generating enzyme required for sulfatase activity
MVKLIFYSSFLLGLLLLSCTLRQEKQNDIKPDYNQVPLVPSTSSVRMVLVRGGGYKPFYGNDSDFVKVRPFLLDERPVTNGEFLDFVRLNPSWRKSAIKRIFADSTYLRDWPSDLSIPAGADPEAPVCYVSWFAAKAFAQSVHKRLPTLDEWEFVAMSDETAADARSKASYSDHIVTQYMLKDKQYLPVKQSQPNFWGVYNMFDRVWEWTDDFNSVLTTADSRTGQYDDKGLFCAASATTATDVLNYAAFMRFGFRTSLKANYTVSNLGFRCAKDTNLSIR